MEVRSQVTRRSILAMISAAALILGVLLIVPSQAAPVAGNPGDAVFQLEGNASDDGVGDDWANIFLGSGFNSATATTGIVDDGGQTATIFVGGGSKDPNDISAWKWKDGGGLPDKDNLLHAFAARYGSLVVFGSDRFDNSGDAQQGFWLFQNPVGTNTDGTFHDVHKAGDVLILSDFSIGGTVTSISVYQWVDSGGDVSTHLLSLFSSNAANCVTVPATSGDVCGVVNPTNGTATGGWDFTDKSGNNTYLQGEFYEGGINLAAFPGLSAECFASFASETRASQSPMATLKDFVVGGFQACQSTVTTAQTWVPNDSASVSGGGASSFTGDIAFTLYKSTDCTGTVLYGPETFTDVSGTSSTPATASTTNDGVVANGGYTATADGDFSWGVTFTSKTSGVQDSSHCETSSLTVAN
jgi:hypothetical protein